MIIKVLLLLGLLLVGAMVVRGGQSAATLALRRITVGTVLLMGVAAILFPNAVTGLANLVGVGRGADLVLYLLVITFLFASVGLYRKIYELENRFIALSRRIAIDEALRQQMPAAAKTLSPPASDQDLVPETSLNEIGRSDR